MSEPSQGWSPAPVDLDAIGVKFGIPPSRMEELVSLRRLGVSDAELLTALRAPSNDPQQPAQPIPLTDEEEENCSPISVGF